MPTVHVELTIAAPIDDVWRLVVDVESYAAYMDSVESVTLTSDDGHRREMLWSVLLKGSVLEWTESEVVDHANHRMEFHQVDGDLDRFDGFWQLGTVEGGTSAELV